MSRAQCLRPSLFPELRHWAEQTEFMSGQVSDCPAWREMMAVIRGLSLRAEASLSSGGEDGAPLVPVPASFLTCSLSPC